MRKRDQHDYKVNGCIFKKPTSSYLYAELTYKQPDGEVQRISRSTKCKRMYDAVRRMDEMIRELQEELSSAERQTHEVTRFIHDWLEKVEAKEIEETTLETYRMHYAAYIQPYFDPLNLVVEELRPKHIWDFVEYMRSIKTKKGTSLKICTIKKVLSNIKLAMDYAVRKEIIEMNPVEPVKLKTKRKEKFTHSFYTIEQLIRLWRAAKGTIFETAIVLGSIYGPRRGEVSGLEWTRVDFENLGIRIEKTRVYAGSKPVTKGTKTESSMRTMPMISPIKTYLLKVQEKQQQKADEMGQGWANSGYVVVDDLGKPIRPVRLSNNFKRILEESGLPHIRFHDLRHSVATYMLVMGVPIAEISAWLGHKSVSTTANIYAHVTDEMRENAAKWMDASYKPKHEKENVVMTLDEAIQKLFEHVLYEEERALMNPNKQKSNAMGRLSSKKTQMNSLTIRRPIWTGAMSGGNRRETEIACDSRKVSID